jgi:hypothetical protein
MYEYGIYKIVKVIVYLLISSAIFLFKKLF